MSHWNHVECIKYVTLLYTGLKQVAWAVLTYYHFNLQKTIKISTDISLAIDQLFTFIIGYNTKNRELHIDGTRGLNMFCLFFHEVPLLFSFQ